MVITKVSHKVKFLEKRTNRYLYEINGVEVDISEKLSENDISKMLLYIQDCLLNMVDLRKSSIDIHLKYFMLFGYLCFNNDLTVFIDYYIEDLILNHKTKKVKSLFEKIVRKLDNINLFVKPGELNEKEIK